MKKTSETQKKESYTEDEINELAEWLEDLTLKQAFFIKESYEIYLKEQYIHETNLNVH